MLTIELKSDSYYSMTVTLDGSLYSLTLRWVELESAWYLDLDGLTDPTLSYRGIKLVGGVDLVEPFGILGFGELWCIDLSDQARDPGFDNIETDFVLLYR